MGLNARKLVFGCLCTTKVQTIHTVWSVQAFVIHFLESFISRLALSEISVFYLVSVAEQAGFKALPLTAVLPYKAAFH